MMIYSKEKEEWLRAVLSLLYKAIKEYSEGTHVLLLKGYLEYSLYSGIKLHSPYMNSLPEAVLSTLKNED